MARLAEDMTDDILRLVSFASLSLYSLPVIVFVVNALGAGVCSCLFVLCCCMMCRRVFLSCWAKQLMYM